MRENLAAALFTAAGVPAPAAFHLQVRLNGGFHGRVSHSSTSHLDLNHFRHSTYPLNA
jgi:hypothetical protein